MRSRRRFDGSRLPRKGLVASLSVEQCGGPHWAVSRQLENNIVETTPAQYFGSHELTDATARRCRAIDVLGRAICATSGARKPPSGGFYWFTIPALKFG